jgi:hypothetical protein
MWEIKKEESITNYEEKWSHEEEVGREEEG